MEWKHFCWVITMSLWKTMDITVVPCFILYDLGVAPSQPPPNGILEGPARIPMPAHRFGFKLDLNQKNPKKDCLSWGFLPIWRFGSPKKNIKKPGPMCRKKVVFKKTHPIFQNAFDVKLRKSYLNDPTSVSFLVDDFTRSQDTISTTQWQPQPKQHLLRETKKLRSWWKMATNHHLYLKLSLHKTM